MDFLPLLSPETAPFFSFHHNFTVKIQCLQCLHDNFRFSFFLPVLYLPRSSSPALGEKLFWAH